MWCVPSNLLETCSVPNCDAAYIGQIDPTLRERIAEHPLAFRCNRLRKSAIAKHCIESNHNFDLVNFELIHQAMKGRLPRRVRNFRRSSLSKLLLNDISYTFLNPFILCSLKMATIRSNVFPKKNFTKTYEINMEKYKGNIKKREENMKKYERIM